MGGCDLRRNYGMVVILLSFFCNYDNFTLKLHKRWLFIGRFKVRSVPGKSVALAGSKKISKSITSMKLNKVIINKVIIVINSPIYK